MTKLGLTLAAALSFASLAFAAAPICSPTSTIASLNYPSGKKIPPNNNLLLPAGKAIEAEGQKIVISGRVLDKNCFPVSDASVILWQNSPTGRWLLAQPVDLATPSPVFAGAGRTYTDAEGRFTFITAFPGPLGDRAPFVNIKVMGEGIPDLSTALYFSNDARNDTDKKYLRLSAKARQDTLITMQQDEDNNLVGTIDLVLPAKIPYRTY
ncbi:MAG: hypothetical protein ACOYNL_05655 [Rickettsiales bacterium]